ncbi:hypothetical protein AAFP35_23985 [Gordonia sp. CPCC 206044]|uniref:hypothetical protein n=1 Tax=Gordonia sp. CPCC 206044 TaxID=3140793 RepID=UPI003AF40631
MSEFDHTEFCGTHGRPCQGPPDDQRYPLSQPPGMAVQEALDELPEGVPWCRVQQRAMELAG